MDALNAERKTVNGASILVLGVAYKRDIDDLRESPALDIIALLEERGATVEYHDPFVPSLHHEGLDKVSIDLAEPVLEAVDCLVVVTDHSTIDYEFLAAHTPLIVDTRNALAAVAPSRAKVVRL
jgi:UDP-N-acetyl-D-glucosamine dehydrogenase